MSKAFMYARFKHEGQLYGERPYLEHLSAVSNKVVELFKDQVSKEDLYLLIDIAWLHDIQEDCGVSNKVLLSEGFPRKVVASVHAISKREEETRKEYLQRCCKNKLALLVKIADTLCNLQESIISDETRRVTKYTKQLQALQKLRGL